MGDMIGNLGSGKLPYDYSKREYGTVPPDNRRPFRWVSEVAYKNVHRIVARGYDTTEVVEAGYGMIEIIFIDFQARIPTEEEEQMLNYVMVLSLEDGLSLPATMARVTARSKTFLTQACGAAILAFGHAYGAYSTLGNLMKDYIARAKKDGMTLAQAAEALLAEHRDVEALGVSDLMLKDPAARRMIARAEKLGVAGEGVAFMKELAAAARKASPTPVDIDMTGANAAVMMDLGFTPEATWAILAVTRSYAAGAHYIEEVEREGYTLLGQELTPQAWYDGPADKPVPAMNEGRKAARPAFTTDLKEWYNRMQQGKKLHGSGFGIVEEIEDPSEKTGIKTVGR